MIILGDKTLDYLGVEKLQIDGNIGWIKRFEKRLYSNMHYITPLDDISNQILLDALYDAGYQDIVNAIGDKFNHTSLTCYYPSIIAVSHCTSTFMHTDSLHDDNYNLIFPLIQSTIDTSPVLIVEAGDDNKTYLPYRYEYDHGILLGNNGYHGTASCDYRNTKQIRIVMSIYMADYTNEITLDEIHNDWGDPPYPHSTIRKADSVHISIGIKINLIVH